MTNDLIASIGRQLNIPKSTDNEWICQIIYSVAGKMALASLWDRYEDKSCSVSIQHFKNRAAQIFDAYEGIYPEIGFLFPKDVLHLPTERVLLSFLLSDLSGSAYNSRKRQLDSL